MLSTRLMRSAFSLVSAIIGGVGVFSAISAFSTPTLAPYALILLGSAFAISYISGR
jgi:hypothetical protein